MEKREFKSYMSDLLKLNKIANSKNATLDSIKRLNYLIIEMGNKGATFDNICDSIVGWTGFFGLSISQDKFNLICRVYDQLSCPNHVYNPNVSYKDDLSKIRPTITDKDLVEKSNWYSSIKTAFAKTLTTKGSGKKDVFGITNEDIFRFTQCYMLLEQIGREEMVIDHVKNNYLKKVYKPSLLKGIEYKGYHHKALEVDVKIKTICGLLYGYEKSDFRKSLFEIVKTDQCKNIDDYNIIRQARNLKIKFMTLEGYFQHKGENKVVGDAGTYTLEERKFHVSVTKEEGKISGINKYPLALSMADVVDQVGEIVETEFKSTIGHLYTEYEDRFPDEEVVEEVREGEVVSDGVPLVEGDASDMLGEL